MPSRIATLCLLPFLAAATIAAPAQSTPALRTLETRYYIIHTDLDEPQAREAALRMTRMAEEYHQRTQGFAGRITQRLPFYLYRHTADYLAAGGTPGTAGFFDGQRLTAVAGQQTTVATWHAVQHEGFHQFARSVIRGDLPAWVNEGLAEYFGEALFTGDGFVTGLLPPWRLDRLKRSIERHRFKPLRDLMLLTDQQWNDDMALANYDQAWSLVHFLAHADGGKYQPAFVVFLNSLGRGVQYQRAWLDAFGPADELENRWQDYYLQLPDNPAADLYARAAVATFTSFLARSASQKQTFDTFDAFLAAAQRDELRAHPDDWLPPSLLQQTIKAMKETDQYTLDTSSRLPQLIRTAADGTRLVGTFTLKAPGADRIDRVTVDLDDLPRAIARAKLLLADRKTSEARALLRAALADHPKSPHAPDARRLLNDIRN